MGAYIGARALLDINLIRFGYVARLSYRVPTPLPLPLGIFKADVNHLNEEITLLLPTGIGERYSQSISNLGHAALLHRCELPL